MTILRTRYAAVAGAMLAASALAQQGNIVLNGGNISMRQYAAASWSLTKNLSANTGSSVTWQINAIKTGGSSAPLTIDGFVRMKNVGASDATIGNIIVNLQAMRLQPGGCWDWQTLTSNVADATNGDAATSAVLCTGASSEHLGQFTENVGSGTLLFTDRDTNAIFSLVPQAILARGESVPLRYTTTFSPAAAGFQAGELVRVELIVTFGQASEAGGHGAICSGIDMTGNGTITPDENHVRSVPIRMIRSLPDNGTICNNSVVLTDLGPSATGTVSFTGFDDQGLSAGLTISESQEFFVTAYGIDGGANGGDLCNTATLTSIGENDDVIDDTHEDGCRRTHRFVACDPIDLTGSWCEPIGSSGSGGFMPEDFLTYMPGDYGSAGEASSTLVTYYTGLQIGLVNGAGPYPNHVAVWQVGSLPRARLQTFLGTPDSDPPSALTVDLLNPTSIAGGALSQQVAALSLNIAIIDLDGMSCQNSTVYFGDLYYCNPGDSLSGLSIRDVLVEMNAVLGMGDDYLLGTHSDHSYSTLAVLAAELNGSFAACGVSEWAATHLKKQPCP